MLMRSTSMPRPKRSVVTRILFLNSLKAFSLSMRLSEAFTRLSFAALWPRAGGSGWSVIEGNLHSFRRPSRASARFTFLTKITTWLNSRRSSRSMSFLFFCFSSSATVYWRRPCSVSFASDSTVISCGPCMNFLQMSRVSELMVALNIMTCFFFGVLMKICCTSRRMERLSMHLSHSSNTKCVRPFIKSLWSRISWSTRPGVPTTICGQSSFIIFLSTS
mmetsp:Transcript_16328/g.49108  ORF Transcript_16328/g.49108 Transcript_16328/m.49108 type:complete len:219 (-) Transcript_16328:519-1175(-)